ncbi:MAG: hypothetical protein MPJ22_00640 [Pirellulales bacterium]|nr:hypothetical protein [Alphaproteobacteria bacterium]MDA8030051.1 hypothetical protein [Alphaproteobacteria bacterium]MDA8040916.1 hypothetical protein [Pirellulales bacterium]
MGDADSYLYNLIQGSNYDEAMKLIDEKPYDYAPDFLCEIAELFMEKGNYKYAYCCARGVKWLYEKSGRSPACPYEDYKRAKKVLDDIHKVMRPRNRYYKQMWWCEH